MRGLLSILAVALTLLAAPAARAETASAVFAGGCFWCMEGPFDKLDGVKATTSGYAGGTVDKPTYRQVSGGATGHAEVVKVDYDPAIISYERLLETFWHNVDPFDASGQFCDKGSQYRPAIFPADEAQRKAAEASKAAMNKKLGRKTVVGIETLSAFWPAEDYHQNFYRTNESKYKFYRRACGRDARLQDVWGAAAGH